MPLIALLVVAGVLLWGCASPIPELWPPTPDGSARAVYVSLDTWHAMIAFPVERQADSQGLSAAGFEEWGYAERAWYLEGRTGVTGILRALFWPTEGVVEVGRYDRVWADRTPQPPAELFAFRVGEEGYRRLRRHLRSTVSSEIPVASLNQSTFYPAVRSYHLFHTCHQYAATALREAGLPVSTFWAFSRASLAAQLRRATSLSVEQIPGLSSPR